MLIRVCEKLVKNRIHVVSVLLYQLEIFVDVQKAEVFQMDQLIFVRLVDRSEVFKRLVIGQAFVSLFWKNNLCI